jgi:hydrogenase maturation factor HypE
MEIYTDDSFASSIIKAAKNLNIDAQVIGRVEKNNKKELIIKTAHEDLLF